MFPITSVHSKGLNYVYLCRKRGFQVQSYLQDHLLPDSDISGERGPPMPPLPFPSPQSPFHVVKNDLSNSKLRGFRGGAVVESLPANAGDTGSSPGLGRSYMPWSSWAREPQLLSLRVWSLCSAMGEAVTIRGSRTVMKSGPHLPQLEKALAQQRRPNTAKKKNSMRKKFKKKKQL